MSATTINILPLNCFKYVLNLPNIILCFCSEKMILWSIYPAHICCLTRILLQLHRIPATLLSSDAHMCSLSMAVFSIHLFRSQANQPAAHLTSRSFICIFAELFSVYSSPQCISEDPCISLAVSLLPFTRSQIHMP